MRRNRCWRRGLADLCAMLNMPPPLSEWAFSRQMKGISSVANDVVPEEMSNAAQELHELMMEEDPPARKDAVLNRCCCFVRWNMDDTRPSVKNWSGTGYIHWHWKSFRPPCSLKSMWGMQTKQGQNYQRRLWNMAQNAHRKCKKNHVHSSNAMKAAAAAVLSKRSIETHKMHYKWMICDGTAKHNTRWELFMGRGRGNRRKAWMHWTCCRP